ncbi:MAG: PID-CTERM protein-sorting domain-containing protein [Schleiferiaceae bacterium]
MSLAQPLRAEEGAYQDPFQQAFEDMFALTQPDWIELATSSEPPPPDVPLDGGLVALVVAGSAAGYRQLRRSRPNSPNQSMFN